LKNWKKKKIFLKIEFFFFFSFFKSRGENQKFCKLNKKVEIIKFKKIKIKIKKFQKLVNPEADGPKKKKNKILIIKIKI
jgi:hypothetical protein